MKEVGLFKLIGIEIESKKLACMCFSHYSLSEIMKIVLKLENVKNIRSRTGCNKTHIFENIKNLLDDPIVCRNLKKNTSTFENMLAFQHALIFIFMLKHTNTSSFSNVPLDLSNRSFT